MAATWNSRPKTGRMTSEYAMTWGQVNITGSCVCLQQNLHMVATKDTAVAAPERCIPHLPDSQEQRQQQLWPTACISLVCAYVCISFHPLKALLGYIISSPDNHRKGNTARTSVLPLNPALKLKAPQHSQASSYWRAGSSAIKL